MRALISCLFAAAVLLAGAAGVALAADGSPAKPKAAQAYSVYHEEEGLPSQLDNHDDAAEFATLQELSRHLMRSAVRMSKYRLPEALPNVTRVARPDLERRGCPASATHCQVSALYVVTEGILFAEDLAPETNLFHRSILFHEMVHYLQEVNREMATSPPCDRWFQREVEAYALQNRFLGGVYSPERVSYSGARPTCEPDAHTHRGQDVKAPDAVNE